MSDAPGWDALNRALAQAYPNAAPTEWESLLRADHGNPDPLDAVRCYRCADHWHYVTFGLTELYRKVSNLVDQSGFGFELTFRLAGDEAAAPHWPIAFLQGLAGYVFRTRSTLAPGDVMDLGGPLGGRETGLTAALFVADPVLAPLETAHGAVRFVQAVGLTRAEFLAARDGGAAPEDALRLSSSLRVTDLARAAPERAGEHEAAHLAWHSPDDEQVELTLDEQALRGLREVLQAGLTPGSPILVTGPEQSLRLEAGERADWSRDRATLVLKLPPDDAGAVARALDPAAREMVSPALPFLRVRVLE